MDGFNGSPSADQSASLIDSHAEKFENAWRESPPASLESFADQLRSEVDTRVAARCLLELVKIDLEFRYKSAVAGEIPIRSLPEYLAALPELTLDVELLAEEYRCRRKWGDRPTADAYLQEFGQDHPGLSAALSRVDAELQGTVARGLPREANYEASADTIVLSANSLEDSRASGPNRREPPELDRIDRYRIERSLGSGNFGHVFLAQDEQLGRKVAIKLPHDESASLSSIAEAVVACSVSHPNLVTIYDVVPHGATHAIIMEYIDGCTLEDWLTTHEHTRRDALRMLATLATALHACHRAGVYHCDFKPANVLLDGTGQPRITDFGLSIRVDKQRQMETRVAGSPAYMAPEQIRGEVQWLDGRTDIWALGVLLYRVLSGVVPFDGQTLRELFDEIMHREPRALRQRDDSIAPELEQMCQRCLAKRIRDRYSSAQDLAEDLEQILERDSMLIAAAHQRAGFEPLQVLDLPALRPLLGRDTELSQLSDWIHSRDVRIVCIVGPAGMGKTAVAVEAARRAAPQFAQIRFLEMGQVRSPAAFYEILMDHYGIPSQAGASLETLRNCLFAALRSLPAQLIVLDNCEHVATADEPILEELSAALPHIRLLITSRLRTSSPATRTFELEPLRLSAEPGDVDAIPPAVRFFEQCAQEHDHRFTVTPHDYPHVLAICEHVEGIPLAIELAASRISLLAPAQILARLSDRRKFFAGVRQSGPHSQRSLSSAIRWSFDLLSTEARCALSLLGLLPGGVFPEQAEQIITRTLHDADALELFEELRRHSLLQSVTTRFGKRLVMYRAILDELHELRQQFGPQLIQSMSGHVREVMLDELQPLLDELRTPNGPAAIDRIVMERDNLLAIQQSAGEAGDVEAAAQATLILAPPLLARGASGVLEELWRRAPQDIDGDQGIRLKIARSRWLRTVNDWTAAEAAAARALADARQQNLRVLPEEALLELGLLANARGEFRAAQDCFRQVVGSSDAAVKPATRIDALSGLGHVAERIETLVRAVEIYDEALKLAERAGDSPAQATILRRKGNAAAQLGRLDEAIRHLNDSIRIAESTQSLHDQHLALTSSGVVYSEMGQFEQAIASYDRSQEIASRIGARRAIATNEGNRGVALAGLADHVAAIHCYRIAEEINQELGHPVAAAINLGNAAVSTGALGDWDAALAMIQTARDRIEGLDDRTHRAIIDGDFGMIQYCRGQIDEAASLLDGAIESLESAGLGSSPAIVPILEFRARCETNRGNEFLADKFRAASNRVRHMVQYPDACQHPLLAVVSSERKPGV